MLRRGLLQEYANILSIGVRIIDVCGIVLCGFMAYIWQFNSPYLPVKYQIALLLGGLISSIVFSWFEIYDSWRGRSYWSQARALIMAWVTVLCSLMVIATLLKTAEYFSRYWLLVWGGTSLVLLLLYRAAIMKALHALRHRGWNQRRIIIIGCGDLGQKVARTILHTHWLGLKIIAFLDDNQSLTMAEGIKVKRIPEHLDKFIKRIRIDEVWFALPLRSEGRIKNILDSIRHNTATIRFVPDIFGFKLINPSISEIASIPIVNLSCSPMVGINRYIKAIEDRMLGLLILILITPLLFIIALGIKLTSPGPILFKQLRHGWDGKPITVYKFRTMVVHEEEGHRVTQAKRDDARITKIGAFLRKTSLDELPQFFNVLQGRMSIVGPRPHAIIHNEQYKDLVDGYMQRHKVKPGITGWAQVNGWRGETDTLEKMQKRVEYDLFYIQHWSLAFDLKIIFMTIFKGFKNKNAY